MTAMNKVFLMGNLTRDLELRKTTNGHPFVSMGLAISEKYRTREGNSAERVCFVDITVWGRQAENCAKYLSKGSSAMIEGRLELNEWQDDQGQKHNKLKVVANNVQFLNGGNRTAGEKSGRPAA